MTSSDPQAYPVFQCCFCDRSYYNKRALGAHRRYCQLKVPGQNAAGQAEASSNAQGGIDVLSFHIPRRQRTVRKEKEAVPVLSEQPENNPASDDAQDGNNGASGFHMPKRKWPILTEPATSEVKADQEPEEEVDVLEALFLLQEQPGKVTGSDGEPGIANPDDELAADNPDEVLTTCFDKSSSFVECYGGCERWGNLPAVVGREAERLSHNEGIDVLSFHIARRRRTVRKEKEALPVLSEQPENNPASDDAQVGNNGASGFHMPKQKRPILTEPTTSEVKADREPEEEVDVLEALLLLQEQPGKGTSSDGEPGIANPDDELAADNPDEVLTTCFDKSSSSVECYGGCERWGNLPAVVGREAGRLSHNGGSQGVTDCVEEEEVELSHNDGRQGVADCAENSAVMELTGHKLDLNVTDTFLKKSGNEVPVAVKEDVLPSAFDHNLSLMQEQNEKPEVKPKLPDLNL